MPEGTSTANSNQSASSQPVYQSQSAPKSKMRPLYILLVLLIVSGTLYSISRNTDLLQRKKQVTIDLRGASSGTLSMTVPSRWQSDPYYPNGNGFPISIFASKAEKERAGKAVFNAGLFEPYRMINGTFYKTNTAMKTIADELINSYEKSNQYFKQEVTPTVTIPDGEFYKCLQSNRDSNVSVKCYVYFESKKYYSEITLYTDTSHLKRDLKIFFNAIKSLSRT